MRFGSKQIGPDEPVYIIAEMACAHDGSVVAAIGLVDAAVAARANAIQLQLFSAPDLMVSHHEVYDLLVDIQFSAEEWRNIHAHARAKGIDVLACTYDLPSVELAMDLGVDGIKLNSSDLGHEEMLRAVCEAGVPFTLGTGASTLEEIATAVAFCRREARAGFVLMHGVQNFPTPLEVANIRRIRTLQDEFGRPVGYQDHTDATDPFSRVVDLLALGLGVWVLEKHITLDRGTQGTDHEAALEPLELAEYVRLVREAEQALGRGEFDTLTDGDLRYRIFQKKNVVAARDIAPGEEIKPDMLSYLRAGRGLSPSERTVILGRKAGRRIERHEPILPQDVTERT